MRRCLVVLVTAFAATLWALPRASAGDAPIGHLGTTLRVDTGKMIADVTVSSVQPIDPPPGFGYNRVGIPVKSFPRSAAVRADVAIHAVRVPTPFQMATDLTFDGVTPFGDAYKSRPSDAPDALDAALTNAPAGSVIRGGVYREAHRDPVSAVVLLDRKTECHLAQWNL
ncbi:hypothetical protein [Candidatus Mycobacterium methanotrophicum]|uniref:MPT63-like domain-containing protein n=1 Tax=Candidatus Mycobacterium methanotrophicum TaxID=2943498 RepID=A0ABY4QGX5_9MYCO|nr:hypothetical protein [Candidatus Mycobacterium methanotrophicum]UQX10109.1 hypothetical protein M5I08_18175 [Candidatus Mycobacterium methanotrophicum]